MLINQPTRISLEIIATDYRLRRTIGKHNLNTSTPLTIARSARNWFFKTSKARTRHGGCVGFARHKQEIFLDYYIRRALKIYTQDLIEYHHILSGHTIPKSQWRAFYKNIPLDIFTIKNIY